MLDSAGDVLKCKPDTPSELEVKAIHVVSFRGAMKVLVAKVHSKWRILEHVADGKQMIHKD